jgi:hypothetical protein
MGFEAGIPLKHLLINPLHKEFSVLLEPMCHCSLDTFM